MSKEKYLIIRDRSEMPSPVYWNAVYQTSLKTRGLYNVVLSKEWNYFKSGNMKSIFLKDDWNKKGEYIADKLLSHDYFSKIRERVKRETEKTEKFLKEKKNLDLSKLSFKELIKLADRIKKICLDYDIANVLAWFLAGDKFQEKIFKLIDVPKEDSLLLLTPKEKTAVSQLEYKLLKYARLIKKRKKDLEKTAEELSEDYGWIPFGYDGPEYWDRNYFKRELSKNLKNIERIEKEIVLIEKKDKERLLKRSKVERKMNKKQLDLIKKVNELAVWTDERKKHTFQFYYCYSRVLWELEKRYGVSYKNLKYLFTEELKDILKKKDYLKKITNKRIENDFMIKAEKGEVYVLPEQKKNRILKDIEKQIEKSSVKGMVACKGLKKIYKAKVKIVLSPKEGGKVKNGDFLVATMTSPNYIMAMKRAAGFITDEGGVTCHVAIISREMNKPCIIGTKIATKVLKDEDLVEVDTDKGIIRKLE